MALHVLSLRTKLVLSHLGLVLLAMALSGLYILGQMEQFYLSQLEASLRLQATLAAELASSALGASPAAALGATLAAVDRDSSLRVRVVDATGRLVAATEAEDAPLLGAVLTIPDLDAALRGQRSSGVVRNTAGPDVLYVVTPVVSQGQVLGAVRVAYALADVNREVAALRQALVAGLAGVGAATVLIALWLAVSLTAPARRLAQAAAQLARGDLATRSGVTGGDEIAAAARAFDDMAAQLQALEQARRELMAAVAHDLHSSTMALGMAAEALQRGAADEPELRAVLLQGMVGHSQRLTRLADDLLQAAQLETGSLRLEREPVAPAAALALAAAGFAAEAAERRVQLAVQAAGALPALDADPARLDQALANLIENALRHSPPGSTVRLAARPEDGMMRLVVADQGPGMPTGAGPASPAGQRPGRLGLGLSIVRGLASAHGGWLEWTSEPGQGTAFSLLLPLAATGAAAPAPLAVSGGAGSPPS
jgi:signal transduction histidine kinase